MSSLVASTAFEVCKCQNKVVSEIIHHTGLTLIKLKCPNFYKKILVCVTEKKISFTCMSGSRLLQDKINNREKWKRDRKGAFGRLFQTKICNFWGLDFLLFYSNGWKVLESKQCFTSWRFSRGNWGNTSYLYLGMLSFGGTIGRKVLPV